MEVEPTHRHISCQVDLVDVDKLLKSIEDQNNTIKNLQSKLAQHESKNSKEESTQTGVQVSFLSLLK